MKPVEKRIISFKRKVSPVLKFSHDTFNKNGDHEVKMYALVGFIVTVQLICVYVFTYHDTAQIPCGSLNKQTNKQTNKQKSPHFKKEKIFLFQQMNN